VLQEIKPTHYPKQIDSFIRVFEIMRGEFDSVWTTMENILSSFCENLFFDWNNLNVLNTARKDTSKFSITQKLENNNFYTFLTENNKTKNCEK
jgi:Asp-tRNA(Asn)/Glu-tRNA(Gln) amidotransferase C subunit